ncbi:MAG: hypothetical protein EOO06_14835 [Chitinophagaceae bacterium]|nr:MAG: hypothetical protein EOO06_14835 [Chitinophagaceae bacterium]
MKFTFVKLTCIVIFLSVVLSSCATIFGKSSYPFRIATDPAGAQVTITNKKGKEIFKGASPTNVTLKSGAGYFSRAEYQVKLSAPGYDEQIIPINFKMNGWYFGNLLIGGFLGMLVIDPISGAMWKLETSDINTSLLKSTGTVMEPTLKIMQLKDVPEKDKSQLVKIK